MNGEIIVKNFVIFFVCLLLSACATKNYGRLSTLTEMEKNELTCREIDIEIAKVSGFLERVENESQFDTRSVLSFLGDFGIGNMLEKDSAVESAHSRLKQLQELKAQRGCRENEATKNKPLAKVRRG